MFYLIVRLIFIFSGNWNKYFSVFIISSFKFIFGPITGISLNLNPVEIWVLTTLGMMFSVVIITFIGVPTRNYLKKKFRKKRKIFTRRNRFIVRVWKKYGVQGIAFFTPLLFSPILGTLIAVVLGGKRKSIIITMFLWATIWGFLFSFGLYFLRDQFTFIS